MKEIPEFLLEKLNAQYEDVNGILLGYQCKRVLSLRVNTLKSSKEEVCNVLRDNGISFEEVSWYSDALIILNVSEEDIRKLSIYDEGNIYLQSLSSMIPPLILNPKNESILDMAAAPGGKTSEIAALTNNEARIMAIEKNKIRADRLKYNLKKLGVDRINVMVMDARKLDEFYRFDKILLDAPCSGSGTLCVSDLSDFTLELVERSIKVQEELLFKAVQVLKKGEEMVYSTCSILKEENEEQVQKLIDKGLVEVVPIDVSSYDLPLLPSKIEGVITIMPNELYEGFFVAKLRKK